MRVLAINDLSCVGKCSLTVALPIISACGVTCDVLPTAVLSTHTGGFEGFTFRDLTKDFSDILAHWKSLGLTFDVLYSGYLGSIEQIELVARLKAKFLSNNGLFIVDPVMGDSGKLYKGFTPSFVEKMKTLCRQADYILPNHTEACALAGVSYPLTRGDELIQALRELCKRPIVTGVLEENGIAVYYADETGATQKYLSENVQGFFHGAGDVFAAAFVGALAREKNEETAIRLAADFAHDCIRRSASEVPDKRYGLNFEAEIFPFLQKING